MLNRWILAFWICGVMTTGVSAVEANDESLSQIRRESFKALSAIVTQDFEALYTRSDGGIQKVHFYRDGLLHRIERDDLQPMILNGERIPQSFHMWAYNGKRYQLYNKDTQILKLTNTQQALGAIDPLLSPYQWLTASQCQGLRRDVVLQDELWDQTFTTARFIGEETCSGYPCFVAEFPHECIPRPAVFRVYFLKDHSCYPLKHEWTPVRLNTICSTFEVKSFKSEMVNGEDLIMPLEMFFDQTGGDGVSWKGTITTQVTPESVILNRPVDHKRFTLDVPTKTIYDVDGQIKLAEKADAAHKQFVTAPIAPQPHGIRSLFVIANLVAIVAVLLVIWRKNRAE